MTEYVFDIEADGLYDTVTKIHCIVAIDYSNGVVHSFNNNEINKGLELLSFCDTLIGHNIIDYDLRVIRKLYPEWEWSGKIIDTLIRCKCVFPDRRERDKLLIEKGKRTKEDFQYKSAKGRTVSMQGRHSLKSYGVRLGFPKDDYTGGWENFNEEMFTYCIRDVELNYKLMKAVELFEVSENAFELEQEAQAVISEQVSHGWIIDRKMGESLYAELVGKREESIKKLQEIFPAKMETMKTPEYYSFFLDNLEEHRFDTKAEAKDFIRAYKKEHRLHETLKVLDSSIKDGPLKVRTIPFNPSSAQDVADGLAWKYGWEPAEYNTDGSPRCGVEILSRLDYPEAKMIMENSSVQDALEKLAEGSDGGYIHMCDGHNRIHGIIDLLGASTNRATHRSPNMAQVTSVDKPFGKELRSLFTVPDGYKLVGTDASQQEIRVLAHYLAEWDGGAYAKIVDESDDIHTENQVLLKLESRSEAKTALYAMLYGEGNWKIGKKMGVEEDEKDALLAKGMADKYTKKALEFSKLKYTKTNVIYYMKGKEIKEQIFKNFTGLKPLMDRLKKQIKDKGYIVSLDGRKVFSDSPHKGLNYLIQSSAAIISKRWLVILDQLLREEGIRDVVHQLGFIHDECQLEALAIHAERVGALSQKAMSMTGHYYNFQCPLKADYKVGNNWMETH